MPLLILSKVFERVIAEEGSLDQIIFKSDDIGYCKTMKRLCIYVTYNKENKIKEYMGYMIKALRECTAKLYVVCNYPKIVDGEEYVEPYVDGIFYRENKGFDAGAYKDMLCTLLGWDAVYQYDELILMNDSFLGPFYDLNKYFDMMEETTCDFWGMTRKFPGENEVVGKYQSHVQSYFLVFHNRVLKSEQFRSFWENFTYPETFSEAISNYELKINESLESYGFIPMTLTDIWGMVFAGTENPYLFYSLELVQDKGLPILKKKSLVIQNGGFANALKAVDFLEANDLYPTRWIWDVIDNQFYIEGYALDGMNCLEFFYKKYKKVFIYGAGVAGKNLALYFKYKGWKQEGFIVSDTEGQGAECTLFESAPIDDETGIIVSVLHQEISKEIVKYIGKRCRKDQLFIICDCKGVRFIPEPNGKSSR